jgi:hypothetical protein
LKKILFLIYLLCGLVEFKAQATDKSLATTIPLSAIAQILRPNDSQGIAMGLTGVSYREGLFSTYSNPAGLKLDNFKFSFSHIPATSTYSNMNFNQEALGIGLPINKNLMFSVHFFNLNFGEIEAYDVNGNLIGRKRSGIREFQISGSKLFFINQSVFSFGLSMKYLQFYMPALDTNSLLVDTGVRYRINHKRIWYSFGVSISNLGNELKHEEFTVDKPIKLLRSGITVGNMEKFDSNLGLMCTIEYQRSMNDDEIFTQWHHLGIGLEFQFINHLFGRLGYNFDLSDIDKDAKIKSITYGIGFDTPRKIKIVFPMDLSLNYGRGIADYRNLDANVISITLGFN